MTKKPILTEMGAVVRRNCNDRHSARIRAHEVHEGTDLPVSLRNFSLIEASNNLQRPRIGQFPTDTHSEIFRQDTFQASFR